MQGQPGAAEMGVVVEMVDAIGVEEAGAPHQAVDFVAFREQELGNIGAVLPGNAGDGALGHMSKVYRISIRSVIPGNSGFWVLLVPTPSYR